MGNAHLNLYFSFLWFPIGTVGTVGGAFVTLQNWQSSYNWCCRAAAMFPPSAEWLCQFGHKQPFRKLQRKNIGIHFVIVSVDLTSWLVNGQSCANNDVMLSINLSRLHHHHHHRQQQPAAALARSSSRTFIIICNTGTKMQSWKSSLQFEPCLCGHWPW